MSAINNYGNKDNRWIGRILSYESQKEQMSGNSRGCRYRVAIMGVTPFVGGIEDDEVTFAEVLKCGGLGGGGNFRSTKYSPGDVVVGYYLDDEKQNPIITGGLGRTGGIKYGSGRFDAKSGYFGKNQPGNLTGRHESGEQTNDCLPRAESSTDKSKRRKTPDAAAAQLGAHQGVNVIPPPPVPPVSDPPVSEQLFPGSE